MRTKTFLIGLVLAVCLMCMPVICAAASGIPLEPGPVIIETTKEVTTTPTEPVVITTEPTEKPVTAPTTERTAEPTTERTTVRTTEPTTEPTSIGGEKGWIDVYCNVDGATVYFDGVPKGTTAGGILSVEVSSVGTPVSTITVTKSGYTTWSGTPSRMPGNNEHVPVYATINPIATPTTIPPVNAGSIYVQSSPSGAAIYMNGVFEGYAPMTISQIAPGSYQMKATLSGYSPDASTVVVYSGQTSGYYPSLQQSPSPHRDTGTVYVTSSPSSASIYVDGNYYGKTPLTVTLYPGTHNIVLKMSGYNDYSTTVYVYANQAQNLPVTMTTAIFGSVVFTSLPGAAVYMDSTYAGQISSAGSLTLANVPSGNHIFKITASGYNTWMNTVYVQANMVNTISAPLTPSGSGPSPVTATGGLDVSTSPAGASVYVDDLFRGYAPLTLTDLAVGQHTVQISYTGYVDYTGTVSVSTGVTTPLAVTLQQAPASTPTKTPGFEAICAIAGLAALAGVMAVNRRRS